MATSEDFELELSEPNPALIKAILRQPETWTWQSTVHTPYELQDLPQYSSEYDVVQDLFDETSRDSMTVRKIELVENPFLLAHYLLKKEKMLEENEDVTEERLYHGTHEKYVDGICKFNFDWRKRGSSTGHKFGQGVSFTPHVSYAWHYTPSGENVIILAKVLKCRSTTGDVDTVVPPESYDTTGNWQETVFVKYEDDDFYPEYVIHFED